MSDNTLRYLMIISNHRWADGELAFDKMAKELRATWQPELLTRHATTYPFWRIWVAESHTRPHVYRHGCNFESNWCQRHSCVFVACWRHVFAGDTCLSRLYRVIRYNTQLLVHFPHVLEVLVATQTLPQGTHPRLAHAGDLWPEERQSKIER